MNMDFYRLIMIIHEDRWMIKNVWLISLIELTIEYSRLTEHPVLRLWMSLTFSIYLLFSFKSDNFVIIIPYRRGIWRWIITITAENSEIMVLWLAWCFFALSQPVQFMKKMLGKPNTTAYSVFVLFGNETVRGRLYDNQTRRRVVLVNLNYYQ